MRSKHYIAIALVAMLAGCTMIWDSEQVKLYVNHKRDLGLIITKGADAEQTVEDDEDEDETE